MNPKFFNLPTERQDLIRNSAMVEFGEGSFKKTSADSIARRAGVSKGLLFHYFKDKRELFWRDRLFPDPGDGAQGKNGHGAPPSGAVSFRHARLL